MRNTGIGFADDTCNPMMACDGCELWPTAQIARIERQLAVEHDPTTREILAAQLKAIKICYALLKIEAIVSKGPVEGWPASPTTPTIFPGRVAEYARLKDLRGT
jgi:hypothetical protein